MFYISRNYYHQMPRPEVGKWHIALHRQVFHQCPWMIQYEVGIFKVIQMPAEGEMLSPLHYQGFRFTWKSSHPVEVHGAWNIPTRKEIKQRAVIWTSRIARCLRLMWVNMRGLR